MTDQLRAVLRLFAEFNESEMNEIVACFRPIPVSKSNLLLRSGQVCKEFYFVAKGGLRVYFIDREGREKTRYVMLENHIGTALAGFVAQAPGVEFIEAIDDSELLAISHADFYRLNRESHNWTLFYQRILEMAYSFQNRRIEQLVTLTAAQRYELVMKENPAFLQRLSNRVLASYLDIREETLSRLKSRTSRI